MKKDDGESQSALSILANLLKAVFKEVTTIAGRVNLLFDFLLFLIIVVYLYNSTLSSVALTVSSIFNEKLSTAAGDNIVTLIFIFLGASSACIVFMRFTENAKRKKAEAISDQGKEEK